MVEEEVAVEDAAVAVAVEDDSFEGGTTRVARAMTIPSPNTRYLSAVVITW